MISRMPLFGQSDFRQLLFSISGILDFAALRASALRTPVFFALPRYPTLNINLNEQAPSGWLPFSDSVGPFCHHLSRQAFSYVISANYLIASTPYYNNLRPQRPHAMTNAMLLVTKKSSGSAE
jgi:hypothetical protein